MIDLLIYIKLMCFLLCYSSVDLFIWSLCTENGPPMRLGRPSWPKARPIPPAEPLPDIDEMCAHPECNLLFPWNLADSHWGVLKKHNCRDCSDTQSYLTKQSRPPTSVSAWITAKWHTLIVQCEMICPAWVIDAVTTSGGDHWGFHQHRDIFPTSGLSKEQQT